MMEIRAHHLICIPRFKRGGYNKKFSKNLKRISKIIRKNPSIKIKITKNCDDICNFCFFMKENKCKKKKLSDYWIKIQDIKVLKKLNIQGGEILKAKDIFNLLIEKIKQRDLRKICGKCEFLEFCLKYNLNKSFVRNLRNEF